MKKYLIFLMLLLVIGMPIARANPLLLIPLIGEVLDAIGIETIAADVVTNPTTLAAANDAVFASAADTAMATATSGTLQAGRALILSGAADSLGRVIKYAIPLDTDTVSKPAPTVISPAVLSTTPVGSVDATKYIFTTAQTSTFPAAEFTDGVSRPILERATIPQMSAYWAANIAPYLLPNVAITYANPFASYVVTASCSTTIPPGVCGPTVNTKNPAGALMFTLNPVGVISSGSPNGVYDLKRSPTGGYLPDTDDPDWQAANPPAWSTQTASDVYYSDSTKYIAIHFSGSETILRIIGLNGSNVQDHEYLFPATSSVPASVQTTSQPYNNIDAYVTNNPIDGSGSTPQQQINFPTDYARQGEAAAAATGINSRLDTIYGDLSGATDTNSSTSLTSISTDLDTHNTRIGDPSSYSPSVNFDWLPSLMPGAVTTCQPLPLNFTFTHGLLAGIAGEGDIDICDKLDLLRQILGWLIGVTTVFYIFRVFVKSGKADL